MRNFPAGRLWLLIVTTACSSSLFRFGESATDMGGGGTPVREAVMPCNTEQDGVQQRAVDRNSYYAYPRPIYDFPKSHSEPKECGTHQHHQLLCSCSTPKRTNIYDTPRPWKASQSQLENECSPAGVGSNSPASHTSPPPTRSSTLPPSKSSSSDFNWLKSGTKYGGQVSPQERISSSAFRGVVEPQDFGTQPGERMPATSPETEKAFTEENSTSAVSNSLSSRKEDEKEHGKLMRCGTLPSKRMPATSPETEKASTDGNPASAMWNPLGSRKEDEKEHWKLMRCGTLPSKRTPATSPETEKASADGNPASAMWNPLGSRKEDEKEHWKLMRCGTLPSKRMPATSPETDKASADGNPASAMWNPLGSRKEDEKEHWKLMRCGTLPSKRMPATSPETDKASADENPASAMWNPLGSRKEDEKEHWKSMPPFTFAYDSARQPSEKSDVSTVSYDLIEAFLNEVPQEKAPHVDRRRDSHRFSLRLSLFNQKSSRKPSPMPRTLRRNSSKKGTPESFSLNKTPEGSTITDTVAPKHVVRELPSPPAEVFQKLSVREQRELPTPPAEVSQKHTKREQRVLPMPPAELSCRSAMIQQSDEQEVAIPHSTDVLASRDQLIRNRLSPHILNAVLKTEQRILKALQDDALMEFLSSRTGAEQFTFFAHVAARFSEGLNLTPAERLFIMWALECPKFTQYCSRELLLEMVALFEFIAGVRPLEVPPAVKVLLSSATKSDRASLMVTTSSTPPAETTYSRGKLSAEPFRLFFHRISSDDVRRELVQDLMASWSQFASEVKNLVHHQHIKKSMDYPSYRTRFIVYAYTAAAMKSNEETNFFPERASDPIEDALNQCFRDTDLARRMADPEVRSTFVGEIRVKYF